MDTPQEDAVVLHVRAYGDSDAIVTLFAAAHGKVSVFMRGLRSAKRKQSLRPLYELRLELHKKPGSDLFTAQALDIVKPHLRLSEELVRLAAANALLEAFRDLFHEGDADANAYALLVETLAALETQPTLPTLAGAIDRLAAHIGYEAPRASGTLADLRRVIDELEHICGHTLTAHRFFLEVALGCVLQNHCELQRTRTTGHTLMRVCTVGEMICDFFAVDGAAPHAVDSFLRPHAVDHGTRFERVAGGAPANFATGLARRGLRPRC